MNPASNTLLVIAFIVAVLLFVFFGGGALTGHMSEGVADGSDWMGDRSWMWVPALLALGFGVVLFRVILKEDLLQTDWETGGAQGFSQTFPYLFYERTDRVPPSLAGFVARNPSSDVEREGPPLAPRYVQPDRARHNEEEARKVISSRKRATLLPLPAGHFKGA